MAEKSYPVLRSVAAAWRSYPMSEVRGSGQEEQPEELWLSRHRRA